jgi:glycosyltransferase involved in cell wall biosynthesis
MKVLIIHYPNFERGGVLINFTNFLKILKDLNCKKYIITDKNLLQKDIKIYKIPRIKIPIISHKILASLISFYLYTKLLIKCRKMDIQTISFQSSFFISILSFLFKKKIIIRVSEDPIEATKYADNFFLAKLVFLSKFITYNCAHTILVNSAQMKRNIRRMCFNKKKIKLLLNMNIKKINHNINKKKSIFLCVGRLCKQKNQSLLIQGFNYFNQFKKNYTLLIIGDGPDKKKLQEMINYYKLYKSVKILGWKKNIKKYYNNSKFFILASLYEGLPNVLIDALNSNLVAFSTYVSGVSDIYGKNYIKIDKNNYITLGKKMLRATILYNKYFTKLRKQKKNLIKFLNINLSKEYIKILSS